MSTITGNFKQKHQGYKVISLISRKGGSGKSSTCVNLAQAFRICAKKVLVVDADDQGSLVEWEQLAHVNNRMEKYGKFYPDVMAADNANALSNLFEVLDGDAAYNGAYDYIFIDMAGHMNQIREGGLTTELYDEVIKQSDILIMVNNPDMFCVRSNKEACKLVDERIKITGGDVITVSLMNDIPSRIDSGARKSMEAYKRLVKEGVFWEFLNTEIGHSRRVAASLSEGNTAFIPVKEKCAEWYDELMRELTNLMGENSKSIKNLKDLKRQINGIVSKENLITAKSNN